MTLVHFHLDEARLPMYHCTSTQTRHVSLPITGLLRPHRWQSCLLSRSLLPGLTGLSEHCICTGCASASIWSRGLLPLPLPLGPLGWCHGVAHCFVPIKPRRDLVSLSPECFILRISNMEPSHADQVRRNKSRTCETFLSVGSVSHEVTGHKSVPRSGLDFPKSSQLTRPCGGHDESPLAASWHLSRPSSAEACRACPFSASPPTP